MVTKIVQIVFLTGFVAASTLCVADGGRNWIMMRDHTPSWILQPAARNTEHAEKRRHVENERLRSPCHSPFICQTTSFPLSQASYSNGFVGMSTVYPT